MSQFVRDCGWFVEIRIDVASAFPMFQRVRDRD